MKRLATIALAILGCSCAQMPGRDPARTEQELVALHEQWAAARIRGDVAFLEHFYGRELRLQVMDGSIVERKDDIEMFNRISKKDPDVITPQSIRDVDMHVSTYGDTAIATFIENLQGTYKGKYGEMALRMTNVLVWRDGRWQLVACQSTPVKGQ